MSLGILEGCRANHTYKNQVGKPPTKTKLANGGFRRSNFIMQPSAELLSGLHFLALVQCILLKIWGLIKRSYEHSENMVAIKPFKLYCSGATGCTVAGSIEDAADFQHGAK